MTPEFIRSHLNAHQFCLNVAQYEYDKKNRLLKVTGNHSPVTYSYTGVGLLYERVENNVRTRYYYDADKRLVAEGTVGADGKANITYTYLYEVEGKLIVDSGTIDAGILFEIDRELLFDCGYLHNQSVEIRVDRITADFNGE